MQAARTEDSTGEFSSGAARESSAWFTVAEWRNLPGRPAWKSWSSWCDEWPAEQRASEEVDAKSEQEVIGKSLQLLKDSGKGIPTDAAQLVSEVVTEPQHKPKTPNGLEKDGWKTSPRNTT